MKLLFVSLFSVFSILANAAKVQFQSGGLIGLESSFTRIFISANTNGNLNIISTQGQEEVTPVVIQDQRGTDGDLILGVGKGRTLVVSSGFSPDGLIAYELNLEDGRKIKMFPNLYFSISQ